MYASAPMPHHAFTTAEIRDLDLPLLERVAGGDREALNELIHRHADAMWKVALRLSHGRAADAEDIVQEACLACLGSAHTYNKRGSVRSWILAITANAARVYQRKANRRRHHETQSHIPTPSPEPAHDDSALRDATRAGLAELKEPFRIILSLRYLDELDDAAIAATLGLNEVTVRTRCHRALNYLRSALGRRGFSVGTATLITVLAPVHASAMPHAVSQLISTACATGQATTVSVSVGGIGATTSTLWFGAKIAASLVAFGALAVGTSALVPPEPNPVVPQAVHGEAPVVTTPPAPAKDAILNQAVTIHLTDFDLDTALTLLRISLPLESRPHFVIGFPTRLRDIEKNNSIIMYPAVKQANPDEDTNPDENALLIQVSLTAEKQSLQETLDILCKTHELRWWKDDFAIFIDRPLPKAELDALEDAFKKSGTLESAQALAACTDSAGLRILLIALNDQKLAAVAAQAISAWIKQQITPQGMSSYSKNARIFKITDSYDRNIMARFANDPEVIKAVSSALTKKLFSEADNIYVSGQLQLPGSLAKNIDLAKQIPAPNDLAKTLGWGKLHAERNRAIIAALGWSKSPDAIAPLIQIMDDDSLDTDLIQLAARSLAQINNTKATDKIFQVLESEKRPFFQDTKLYALVAHIKDTRIVPLFSNLIKNDVFNTHDVIQSLGLRGGNEALTQLKEIAASKTNNWPNDSHAIHALLLHESDIVDDYLYDALKRNKTKHLKLNDLKNYTKSRKKPSHSSLLKRILLDEKITIRNYPTSYNIAAAALIGHDATEAEKFLFETLPNKDSRRFSAYCHALAGLSERGNDLILKLSADSDPKLRMFATSCLPAIGDLGLEKLRHMIENEEDEKVSAAAFNNLNPGAHYLNGKARYPSPATQWEIWLKHRHEAVRRKAAGYVASFAEHFDEKEWLHLMDTIIASPDLRNSLSITDSSLLKLYGKDPDRWRSALPLFSSNPKSESRVAFWDQVEWLFNGTYYLSSFSPKTKLADNDKTLLLDAAAKAAASDEEPKVRARAGWTLAVSLRHADVRSLPDYSRLEKSLIACLQNETDPRVKQIIKQAAELAPYKTDRDQRRDRAKFKWPKEPKKNQPATNAPNSQSAEEF